MANMHNGNLVPRPSPVPVLHYAKTGAGEGLGMRLAIPARDPA